MLARRCGIALLEKADTIVLGATGIRFVHDREDHETEGKFVSQADRCDLCQLRLWNGRMPLARHIMQCIMDNIRWLCQHVTAPNIG